MHCGGWFPEFRYSSVKYLGPSYLLLVVVNFYKLLENIFRDFEVLGDLEEGYVVGIDAFHPVMEVFCDDFGSWWICISSLTV